MSDKIDQEEILRLLESKEGREKLARIQSDHIRQEVDLERFVHNKYFSGLTGGELFPDHLFWSKEKRESVKEELKDIWRSKKS